MKNGIRRPDYLTYGICPHCGQKLGMKDQMALKMRKKCVCNHCRKVIDEKFKVY